MKIRFLLDENVSPRVKAALLRLNPTIDVLRVGDAGTPALGTLDPEILHHLEASQRLLVTDNRISMPAHLEAHWAAGGHIWGCFGFARKPRLAGWQRSFTLFGRRAKLKSGKIGWIGFHFKQIDRARCGCVALGEPQRTGAVALSGLNFAGGRLLASGIAVIAAPRIALLPALKTE